MPCAVTPIKKGGPKAALFVNGCLSDQHFSFTCAASVGLQSGLFGLNSVGAVSVATVGLFSRVRSEEHTSELQSLMRISYAVLCLKKKKHSNAGRQTNGKRLQQVN